MTFTMRRNMDYITTAVFLLLAFGTSFPLNTGAVLDEPLLLDTIFTSTFPFASSHRTVLGGFHRAGESCAVLTVSSGGNAFLGGNADTRWYDYGGNAPYLFFFPHQDRDHRFENAYGFAVFGWEWKENEYYDRTYASGMNEKGLAFGVSGLPPVPMNPHPERPYSAFSETFEVWAMKECSSVACVIEMAEKFDWGSTSALLNQYHFADSTGDAVVISAGKDGELAFTRKEKGEYLVSTNFNRANTVNGKYPCWRFDTAVLMLQKSEQGNNVDYVRAILDAIHVEGVYLNTAFSYIFDLHSGDIYIYYYHQFDEAIKINLTEELANELFSENDDLICHAEYLPNLFSREARDNAITEFHGYRNRFLAVLLIVFSTVGLSGFFLYRKCRRKSSNSP
jgi:hypothetical protein